MIVKQPDGPLKYSYAPDRVDVLTGLCEAYLQHNDVAEVLATGRISDDFWDRNDLVEFKPEVPPSDQNTSHTNIGIIRALDRACNQTQKRLVIERANVRGPIHGLVALTDRMEALGLLKEQAPSVNSDQEEFMTKRNVLGFESFTNKPVANGMKGLQIWYAMAVENLLYRTTGNFTEKPDSLRKVTNGLLLGLKRSRGNKIPDDKLNTGYVTGLNPDQLYDAHCFGRSRDETFVRKSILGFRHRQHTLVEYAHDQLPEYTNDLQLPDDIDPVLLICEEGGEQKLLNRNNWPRFFDGRYNSQPVAQDHEQINFERIHTLREQVINARVHLRKAVMEGYTH